MTMERTCKPVAAETINKLTFKDKMRAYKRSPLSLILLLFVCGASLITMLTLLYLIAYILVKGIPYITPDLFSFTYTSDNVSLMPALISTVVMTIIALVIALPLGIGAGNLRCGIRKARQQACAARAHHDRNTFGHSVHRVRPVRLSVLCDGAALGLFAACRCVYGRHHDFAAYHAHNGGGAHLGAGFLPRGQLRAWRGQTAHGVSHRAASAVPGILSGVILAIGRVVGESAALMYTAGSVAQMPGQAGGGLFDSVRTLSVHMYVLSSEGLHIDKTYATAVVLLVIVIGINALSSFVAKKITKKQG